jgi:hypothetical protein
MSRGYILFGNRRFSPSWLGWIAKSFTRRELRIWLLMHYLGSHFLNMLVRLSLLFSLNGWTRCLTVMQQMTTLKALLLRWWLIGHLFPHFAWNNGFLGWYGYSIAFEVNLCFSLFSIGGGGHSGFSVTYKKMKQVLAWKGMKGDIKEFVQTCLSC